MVPNEWIINTLSTLTGCDDDLFQRLWTKQRLVHRDYPEARDDIDEISSRLAVAGLRQQKNLLIVLPDIQPHRAAFLLATTVLRSWWDNRVVVNANISRSRPILYFGSSVGIRDQLRCMTITNLGMDLGDVFNQQDLTRGSIGSTTGDSGKRVRRFGLPCVITIYAPADPVGVIQAYKPSWIAIDCCDASQLSWLRPLLTETSRMRIPVIAWAQNHLSECISDFNDFGRSFVWPLGMQLPHNKFTKYHGNPIDLMQSRESTSLTPVVITGKEVSQLSDLYKEARRTLSSTIKNYKEPFNRDAIAIHWRYLHSLENLSTPIDFHESEASRFWGLKTLNQLNLTCQHFRDACLRLTPGLHPELEKVGSLLEKGRITIENQGCPLWSALSNLCVEEPAVNEFKVIVFLSDARKQLFLFALLSRFNFSEDDLRELNIVVLSINELRRWTSFQNNKNNEGLINLPEDIIIHPLIVGLPSTSQDARLATIFLNTRVSILIYPHQCSILKYRESIWSARLSPTILEQTNVIAELASSEMPDITEPCYSRINIQEAIEIDIETTKQKQVSIRGALWEPDSLTDEVSRLFKMVDDSSEEDLYFTDKSDSGSGDEALTSEDIWCAQAAAIQFEQGWYARFDVDDIINVVCETSGRSELDQRFVRALNIGDRVLLIHGQQRQSLYDLIISRVHSHPSIELHLALIRRWQEELQVAYQIWRTKEIDSTEMDSYGPHNLDGLLYRMNVLGCDLVSTLTLSFWLRGFVLCPHDPEDLSRVAEVLDMKFVKQHHKRIVEAANRLRGLHRGLSIKLNRWLHHQATGTIHTSDDEIIDEELGLTFGDIRNSIMVLRVLAKETITGPFLRANLGRVERETNHEQS